MDLEQTIKQMPQPLVAAIVIFVAIIAFLFLNPPHTLCDAQTANLKDSQKGILMPIKQGKKTYPGKILFARESCLAGNSSGACYEYFSILRRVATSVKSAAAECAPEMMGIQIDGYAKTERYEEVRDRGKMRDELAGVEYKSSTLGKVMTEGLTAMVQMAWGEKPPEPGAGRYGWFQESEMAVFCHIEDVLRRGKSPESWRELQRTVIKDLPGEPAPASVGGLAATASRVAVQMMPEDQILERTLFSVNCGNFR